MNEQPPPAAPDSFARLRGLAGDPTNLLAALLVLAVLYTLYFARAFLLPIVLAFLLAIILMPAVRALKRLHLPRALAAALVTLSLAASLGGLIAWIYDPASEWIEKAPYTLSEVESKLRGIKKSVEGMAKVAEKVEQLATPATPAGAKPQPAPPPAQPSLLHRTFSTTIAVLVSIGTVLVLLFFLLATGDVLLQKTVQVMPTRADKKRVVGDSARDRVADGALLRYRHADQRGPGHRDGDRHVLARHAQSGAVGRDGVRVQLLPVPRGGRQSRRPDRGCRAHLRRAARKCSPCPRCSSRSP